MLSYSSLYVSHQSVSDVSSALYDVMNWTHFLLMLTLISASFLTLERFSSTASFMTDSSSESSSEHSDFLIVENAHDLRSMSFISSLSLIEFSWVSNSWCCILLLTVAVFNFTCFFISLIDIIDLDEEINFDCCILLLTVAVFNSTCFFISSIDIISLDEEINFDCCILLLTVAAFNSTCFSVSLIDIISLNEEINFNYCILLLAVAASDCTCFSI